MVSISLRSYLSRSYKSFVRYCKVTDKWQWLLIFWWLFSISEHIVLILQTMPLLWMLWMKYYVVLLYLSVFCKLKLDLIIKTKDNWAHFSCSYLIFPSQLIINPLSSISQKAIHIPTDKVTSSKILSLFGKVWKQCWPIAKVENNTSK